MTHTNTQQKAPRACDSEGLHNDTNRSDFRSHGATNQAHDGKAIANQIARLALAGHTVHLLKDETYLVCKWGYTHHADDLGSLKAFAVRLGVCHE